MAIIVVKRGMSIQAAVLVAQPGDVILVENGKYHEEVTVNKNYIHILANGDKVVLDGQNTLSNGFRINNSLGVEIDGFIIKNYLSTGIVALGGGSHRLLHNKISRIGTFGISITSNNGTLVWRNQVSHITFAGINYTNGSNFVVENTSFKNDTGIEVFNAANGTVTGNKCFENNNGLSCVFSNNTLLLQNDFSRNRVFGSTIDANDMVVIENSISHNRSDGMLIPRANNLFASDNRVDRNTATGINYSGTFSVFQFNHVEGNRQDGIILDVAALNNSLIRNRLNDNKPVDIRVLNVDNNNFVKNKCKKSNPRGLCRCDD